MGCGAKCHCYRQENGIILASVRKMLLRDCSAQNAMMPNERGLGNVFISFLDDESLTLLKGYTSLKSSDDDTAPFTPTVGHFQHF